jgi:hypothetical protein
MRKEGIISMDTDRRKKIIILLGIAAIIISLLGISSDSIMNYNNSINTSIALIVDNKYVNKTGDTMTGRLNVSNSGQQLILGYNPSSGLNELSTIYPGGGGILYYRIGGSLVGFTTSGYAYSAYDDKPFKMGQSGANFSQIYKSSSLNALVIEGVGSTNKTNFINMGITIGRLSGTGNAFVCVYANGTLYRNTTACV